jgi:hypothetical protein
VNNPNPDLPTESAMGPEEPTPIVPLVIPRRTPTAPFAASQSHTPPPGRPPSSLSVRELVSGITQEVGTIARTEIAQAATDLRADLRTQIRVVSGLGTSTLAMSMALNAMVITVIFVLARFMPGWVAGLILSGVTLAVAVYVGTRPSSQTARHAPERAVTLEEPMRLEPRESELQQDGAVLTGA